MTSKLVVNTIEADTGISSVSFASSISMSSASKFHFSAAGIDIGADTNINRPSAGVLGFNINSSEKLRISSSGKINIGDTQTSQNILNIEDGTAATMEFASHGTGGDTAYIGVKKSTGGGLTFGISNRDIIFKTGASYSGGTAFDGGTERLRITSAGLVGIGTVSPAHALDIQGSSGSFTKLALSNQTMNTSKYEIIFGDQGQVNHVVAANREITFATNGSNNERLRITSTGRINIGNNDQAQDVDQFSVTVAAQNALDNLARFQSNAAASGTSETLVKIYKGAGYGGVVSGYITQGSDHGLKLYTANNGTLSEGLRATSNGIIDAPSQAGFYARMQNTKSNVMGGGASYYTIPFDTDSGSVCYDTHNSYNTSNGLYTVPTHGTGHYIVSTAVCLSTSVYGRGGECWFIVGSNRYFFDRKYFASTGGTITGFYGTINIKLTAGQTIGVQGFISGGSQNVDVQGAAATDQITWFTARKIA